MSMMAVPSRVANVSGSSLSLRGTRRARDRRRQKTWHLTRRGRFVFRGLPLLTLAALILLGAVALAHPGTARAGNDEQSQPATALVTVRAGQTLWEIAGQTAPTQDVRDVVNEIMELNDLSSVSIVSGQQLEVPLYTQQ